MKLLYCELCNSLFNLSYELKECQCGRVKGYYKNHVEAVVNGGGHSVAIGNGDFLMKLQLYQGQEYDRTECIQNNRFIAWVRPHEGEGNPHTTVDTNLGQEEANGSNSA